MADKTDKELHAMLLEFINAAFWAKAHGFEEDYLFECSQALPVVEELQKRGYKVKPLRREQMTM